MFFEIMQQLHKGRERNISFKYPDILKALDITSIYITNEGTKQNNINNNKKQRKTTPNKQTKTKNNNLVITVFRLYSNKYLLYVLFINFF